MAVVEALRRGEPWRRALESIAVAAGAPAAIESIAGEACGNWVWLTSFARREAALDVGGAVSSMAAALSRHFRIVHHVESSPLLAEFAARRFAQDVLENVLVSRGSIAALPFGDESFDCVTLHGARTEPERGAASALDRRVFSECRRVLRPDGRLYIATENPRWYGRLASASAWRAEERTLVRSARATGFREIERYYALPAFDRPRVLVPGTRRASYVRESVEASGDVRGTVRRVAALAGLQSLLAPGIVVVARK